MTSILLASASPRRKALFEALGVSFDTCVTDTEERDEGDSPVSIVEGNAEQKCKVAADRERAHTLVIAADTLVFLEGRVLSKPVDMEAARSMLRLLSGNTHQVITGLAVYDRNQDRLIVGFEATDVTFRLLTETEIGCFVEAVRPLDRAGAYTVDGPGSLLVEGYHGCYQNVLGLPLVRLDILLRQLGHSLFDYIDPAKARFL